MMGYFWRGFTGVLLLGAVVILLPAGKLHAATQAETGEKNPQTISEEQIRRHIEEVESDKDMVRKQRQQLLELYKASLQHLEDSRSYSRTAENYTKTQREAKTRLDQLTRQARGEAEPRAMTAKELARQSLPELERAQVTANSEFTALESRLNELEQRIASEMNRPSQAQERLLAARQELESIKESPAALAEEPDAVREARQWLRLTRRQALEAEIHMLEQEVLTRPQRLEVLQAERDQAAREIDQMRTRVQQLEKEINQRRLASAEQTLAEATEARREAEDKHPLLRRLAEENAALGDKLRTLAASVEQINNSEHRISEQAAQIEADLRGARQRLEIAGLSEALGQVLTQQRKRLREARRLLADVKPGHDALVQAGLNQIQHTESRRELNRLDQYVDTLLQEIPEDQRTAVAPEARKLLSQRQALLDKAIAIDSDYLLALSELDAARERLRTTIADYDAFLDRHLLWTRNAPAFDIEVLQSLPSEVRWLVSPENWQEVARVLVHEFKRTPAYVLILVIAVTLLALRRAMRSRLRMHARLVGRLPRDRLGYTLEALLFMVLLASPWPLLLGASGWQLQTGAIGGEYSKAVGFGLLSISVAFGFLRAFRLMCAPNGLADAHFRWNKSNLRLLRRNLGWMILIVLPLAFLAATASRYPDQPMMYASSRLAYVGMMIAIAVFSWRTFHLQSGVLAAYINRVPNGWVARLRYLWYPAAVMIPVILAGIALIGYFYTAGMLARALINTLWLILGLVIIDGLVLRWLSLTRGRIAYESYKRRLESGQTGDGEEEQPSETESFEPEPRAPEVEMQALDVRTRKLLHTGLAISVTIALALIWSEVVPAFGILGKISLWQYSATVAGEEQLTTVTLVDLIIALIIIVISLAVARHLPALLELTLLQRLTPEPGSRYAYSALLRYLIIGGGIIWVFNLLGGTWGQIQWLVAALGIGIGFGFQEIIANFVSGIIILFERPFRVGDVLSVGDTSGTVTRIRIRATTITNWDKQELIVPNKDLITGRLLNWSLTDAVNRVNIRVGVAYGSDIPHALQLLTEVAAENEHVLEEPAPIITFDRFGDNAIELLLRCYLGSVDYRLRTASELHQAINDKFSAAGIVIAFPQRDIHFDSDRPLDIRLHRGRNESGD